MTIDQKKKKALKAQAHHLKPIIRIGQKGITENLLLETEQALEIHELLKIHIANDDRDARCEAAQHIAKVTESEIINQIGKTFTLFRRKKADA